MGADVVEAVTQYLLAQPEVVAAVGATDATPWVFQRKLFVRLKSTQQAAVVVSLAGPWTTPNQHNTMHFPRILVECLGDPTRDANGDVIVEDAEQKALAAFRAVDKYMHRSYGEVVPGVDAAGLRIISSLRLDEPATTELPDGDGIVVARIYYGLNVG